MKAKCSIVFSLLVALGSGSVMGQEVSTYSAADVRDAMVNVLAAIENAAGLESKASQSISELGDEAMETMLSSMADPEQFVATARRIVDRIDSPRMAIPVDMSVSPYAEALSVPFPPVYPANNVHYVFLNSVGLVDSPDARCGEELAEYEAVVATLQSFSFVYETICTVVSCDPTGIVCAVACSLVGIINVAIDTAAVPLRACAAHGNNVDSAEIEAAYENTTIILGDITAQLANLDGGIAAPDAQVLNRLDALDAVVTDILANQKEIIRLLTTPQGRPETKSVAVNPDSLRRSGG